MVYKGVYTKDSETIDVAIKTLRGKSSYYSYTIVAIVVTVAIF